MNGLTPYIDFADSKGPLLWLIYGMGYLNSHSDYTGVFWLSVISYTATFYCLYRAALLFVPRRAHAIVSALLMAIPFFLPPFHYEVRAEDFANLYFAVSVWALGRLCCGRPADGRSMRLAAFALGVCTGALLMIKYNLAVVQLSLVFAAAVIIICHSKREFVRSFVCYLAGEALMVLPFVFYLMVVGAFDAFAHEYFLSTARLVNGLQVSAMHNSLWHDMLNPVFVLYGVVLLLGIVIAGRFLKRWAWIPYLGLVVFYAVFCIGYYARYHYCMLAILYFPLAVYVGRKVSSRRSSAQIVGLTACAVIVASCGLNYYLMRKSFCASFDRQLAQEFYAASHLAGQVPHPTFVYLFFGDYGYGVKAQSLPGCKYWASQNGASGEMHREQIDAITRNQPDFVVVKEEVNSDSIAGVEQTSINKILSDNGYRAYPLPGIGDSPAAAPRHIILYSRHALAVPLHAAEATWTDVILRRNPLDRNASNK